MPSCDFEAFAKQARELSQATSIPEVIEAFEKMGAAFDEAQAIKAAGLKVCHAPWDIEVAISALYDLLDPERWDHLKPAPPPIQPPRDWAHPAYCAWCSNLPCDCIC